MRETIKVIESLELSSEDRKQIYYGNARRLLGLEVVSG
jgi:predicted TIM-barrel fold metal-dependent hydrolase